MGDQLEFEDWFREQEGLLDQIFELAAKIHDDQACYRRDWLGEWTEEPNGR
jgi:hypothetical protein